MTTLMAPPTGLEPVRAALLSRSAHEADELVRSAEDEGAKELAAAQRQVAAIVDAAREQGHAEGAAVRAAQLSAARRQARAQVMAAQRSLFEELRRQARHTVLEVLERPGNRARLADVLRATLGDSTTVGDTADGGVWARSSDDRSVDASIGSLADRILDVLDLGELWISP